MFTNSESILLLLLLQGILEDNDIHSNRIAGIEIKQEANPIVMRCKIHHGSTGGAYIHDRVSYTYHMCILGVHMCSNNAFDIKVQYLALGLGNI